MDPVVIGFAVLAGFLVLSITSNERQRRIDEQQAIKAAQAAILAEQESMKKHKKRH